VRSFVRTTLGWMLLAFVGETMIGPLLRIGNVEPDFTIIALVMLALAEGSFAGSVGGFALGLIQDLTTPNLLGLHALCKSLLGYAVGRLRGRLVYGLPVVEGLLITLAALGHDTLYLLVQSRLNSDEFLRPLVFMVIPGALYSGLIGVPLMRLADAVGILRAPE
jgi:rod shape-determining protein MreD